MPSVIIPANDEAAHLGACLDALAAQTHTGPAEVIVSANACTDDTVAVAESRRGRLAARGWTLTVLDRAEPGKLAALNAADAVATHGTRVYLDADVICAPTLLAELAVALDTDAPRYASGTLTLAPARSWVTRQFGRTWENLPFMTTNVPGAGLFAVNAAGRARWGAFPDIISDDLFARLHFAPEERVRVPAPYSWPLAEGVRPLVRVRRRQDAGTAEIAATYPHLMANESKPPLSPRDHLRLFAARPVSYATYVAVMLAVRFGPGRAETGWTRGR